MGEIVFKLIYIRKENLNHPVYSTKTICNTRKTKNPAATYLYFQLQKLPRCLKSANPNPSRNNAPPPLAGG